MFWRGIRVLVLGLHPAELKAYFWLSVQEPLLARLKGPYEFSGIEPGPAACKAIALPTALLLLPSTYLFLIKGSSLNTVSKEQEAKLKYVFLIWTPGIFNSNAKG